MDTKGRVSRHLHSTYIVLLDCAVCLQSIIITISRTEFRCCLQVVDDWRYISLMFDRLLFYVYAIVTLIGTLSILMYAPHVFATDFNQQAFKREVAIERCCKELHEENPPEKMEDCFRNPDAHKC